MIRVPSMQRAATYSFIAHIVFLVLAIALSRSLPKSKPTIYTVSLVEQLPKKTAHIPAPPAKKAEPKAVTEQEKPQNRQKVTPKPPPTENRQKIAPKKESLPAPKPKGPSIDELKAQRLKEMQQKKQQEEQAKVQMERERRKQESLERIRQEAESRSAASQEASDQAASGRLASEYEIALTDIFYSSWTYPDIAGVYNMRAKVLITVNADGNVNINKILTPSGNRVFDRSVLKAITDAGRVPPPPFGRTVEIEVEFRPEKQ